MEQQEVEGKKQGVGGERAIMVSAVQHLLINHSLAAKWQQRGARRYFRLRYQVS